MQVWPFPPRSEMTETLEWLTDVMRAKGAEQRIALRTAPRRSYAFSHVLDAQQYASAQEMVRDAEDYLVPDWTRIVTVQSVESGSEVAIPFDATCYDFTAGGQAILWKTPGSFEVLDIIAADAGGITAAVADSWASVKLMPLRPAVAPDGMSADRLTRHIAAVRIGFDITENTDQAATAYTQYRGHDVMTDCPKIGLDESVAWPVESIDNQLGRVVWLRERNTPDASFTMRWRVFGVCATKTLRAWLHSRRGRQKVFWLSSRGRDFIPTVNILSADTEIVVQSLPGLDALARDTFDIEIVTTTGTEIRRQVTSWETGLAGTIVLNISAAIGANITIANVRRISWLRCVRFNADRIELIHRAAAGVEVAVPCIEVPVP